MLRFDDTESEMGPRSHAWQVAVSCKVNIIFNQRRMVRMQCIVTLARFIDAFAGAAIVTGIGNNSNAIACVGAVILAASNAVSSSYQERLRIAAAMLSRYMQLFHRFERLFQLNNVDEWSLELLSCVDAFYDLELLESSCVNVPNAVMFESAYRQAAQELGILILKND